MGRNKQKKKKNNRSEHIYTFKQLFPRKSNVLCITTLLRMFKGIEEKKKKKKDWVQMVLNNNWGAKERYLFSGPLISLSKFGKDIIYFIELTHTHTHTHKHKHKLASPDCQEAKKKKKYILIYIYIPWLDAHLQSLFFFFFPLFLF